MITAATTLALSLLGLCEPSSKGEPPPPDTTPTAIRIHYQPATRVTFSIQSSPALTWTQDTSDISPKYTYTYCANVPSETNTLTFRALRNGAWSRGAAYTVKTGGVLDIYPYFNSDTGQLVTLFPTFHSNVLGNDRTIWAWLPPGYDENKLQRHPVLYMHDGRNLFDAASSITGDEWEVDEAMNAGIRSGAVGETIVIAVDRTAQRISEYTPVPDPGYPTFPPLGDSYLRMLVEELKPQVDAALRTRTDAASTGVMGSSLGALISMHAGITYPQVFGRVGALSPSVWWGDHFIANEASTAPAPGATTRVYVDEGSLESINGVALADALRSVGYQDGSTLHYVYEVGGYHTETSWARRLPGALHALYPGRGPIDSLQGASATFVSQTVPSWMYAGSSYTVLVTLKNTGLVDWSRDNQFRLGALSPQDNGTWGVSRVDLAPGELIRPGETKTFQFTIKAPSAGGIYTFQWGMLQEGVTWFGAPSTAVGITAYPITGCPPCPPGNECPAVYCDPPQDS